MKHLLMALILFPTLSVANECRTHDIELGKNISEVFGIMHNAYMTNQLDYGYVDDMRTKINIKYNEEIHQAFQIASRQNVEYCARIREVGQQWLDKQRILIINEINSRN